MARVIELNPDIDTECLEGMLQNISSDSSTQEIFCPSVWDSVYCWPSTPAGMEIKRKCSEIFQKSYPHFASDLDGHASRECLENGSWAQCNESNYDECAESFQSYMRRVDEDMVLVPIVHKLLFYGSIASLVCLGIALAIFYHFRCLRCDRVTVHVQLMLSLVLRFILILVITEPFVLDHQKSFRDVDVVCKIILVSYLYFTFASVSWIFVHGIFYNVTFMTDLVTMCARYHITLYFIIGWGVPTVFVSAYVVSMTFKSQETCWSGYSEMDDLWILEGPITLELLGNGIFLLNIIRILLRKIRNSRPDSSQVRAVVRATLILFPVLGLNDLILLYNPGGDYNKYFIMLNTFFGSTHGILVAFVFCFADKDVRAAIRRSRERANVRRMGNASRTQNIIQARLSPIVEVFIRRENGILEHVV